MRFISSTIFPPGSEVNLNPKAVVHQLDIADAEAAKLIEQIKPDVLEPSRGADGCAPFGGRSVLSMRGSISSVLSICSKAAKNAGAKKVIFASSGGAVYGDQEPIPAD